MVNVVIYTKNICPYCVKAKALLNNKNVRYTEISIENNDNLKAELVTKSGGRKTVPQIFIDDFHVGGCDDLYELEKNNKLDALLFKH